ncbi:MAG: MerR family transcriptional regulator [Campylobacterales bacterium]
MAYIDNKMPIIALSTAADILNIKQRTLRMYEEKKLLPSHNGTVKKLYSLNDMRLIGLVHYLAAYKRINANGVRFIIDELFPKLKESEKEEYYKEAEMELGSKEDSQEIELEKF